MLTQFNIKRAVVHTNKIIFVLLSLTFKRMLDL